MMSRRVWFQTRSDGEKSSPEILERMEPRQHPPESQGGDDRNPHNRAQTGDGAQVISADPSSGSVLKFSSRSTHVRQSTSRSTISVGLKGASF